MKTSICGTCRAPIFWAFTPAGKRMPLNAAVDKERRPGSYAIVEVGRDANAIPVKDARPDQPVHMTHWTTCKRPPGRKRG